MGSALMGSLRTSCFLTGGLFGYSCQPTFVSLVPKVPGRTLFPNLSKIITFAATPLVLTPFVRNQSFRRSVDQTLSRSILKAVVMCSCFFFSSQEQIRPFYVPTVSPSLKAAIAEQQNATQAERSHDAVRSTGDGSAMGVEGKLLYGYDLIIIFIL